MKDKNSQPRPSAFVALSSLLEPARVNPQSMPDPKDGPPCHLCTGRCCKYFALQIDTPTTPEEYDHVRWYLLHQGIVVWMQGGDWYLEVRSPCRHLLPGNQCGIYEKRPAICRTYGLPDEPCEFFTDELEYDLFFDSPEAFEQWAEAQLRSREERLARRRERYRQKTAAMRGGRTEAIA